MSKGSRRRPYNKKKWDKNYDFIDWRTKDQKAFDKNEKLLNKLEEKIDADEDETMKEEVKT